MLQLEGGDPQAAPKSTGSAKGVKENTRDTCVCRNSAADSATDALLYHSFLRYRGCVEQLRAWLL